MEITGGDKKKRRNQTVDISNAIFGKVPPQARDLEGAILGAMMLQEKVVLDVKDILKPEDFYDEAHQRVCRAIFKLSKTNKIDILTVMDALRESEELDIVGGPFFLTKLTNQVVSSAHTITHCRIIKQKSIQRKLIQVSGQIITDCYEDSNDVFDTLQDAETKIRDINFEVAETHVTNLEMVASEIIKKFDTKVYNAKNNIIDQNVIYTGMKEWDQVNGPLFNGLYVVAGRPAMGKGVHLTELACRMGKQMDVGIINGEMTNQQLLTRIGCNLLGIDNSLFKRDAKFITTEEQELVKTAMEATIQLKLHIENSKMIDKIATRIRLWVKKMGVKAVLADFLTLFRIPYELEKYYTDKQVIDYVLKVFADLAYELGIPIILYVQMNREILGRTGKSREPHMGDLKGSGSIEELAFQISMLHRPEYYDPTDIVDEHGENTQGLMYQIIVKHRDGMMKRIKHRALLPKSQLKEWDDAFITDDMLTGDTLPF